MTYSKKALRKALMQDAYVITTKHLSALQVDLTTIKRTYQDLGIPNDEASEVISEGEKMAISDMSNYTLKAIGRIEEWGEKNN